MDEELIKKIWEKGIKVSGVKEEYKKDELGAWIQFSEYGKVDNETNFGWEIDHIQPESKGGKTILSNLRPLQWKNNRLKYNGRFKEKNKIIADENKNIRIQEE